MHTINFRSPRLIPTVFSKRNFNANLNTSITIESPSQSQSQPQLQSPPSYETILKNEPSHSIRPNPIESQINTDSTCFLINQEHIVPPYNTKLITNNEQTFWTEQKHDTENDYNNSFQQVRSESICDTPSDISRESAKICLN